MEALDVRLSRASYRIYTGRGELASMVECERALLDSADRLFIAADATAWTLHGAALAAALGREFALIRLAPGEACMTLESCARMLSFLAEQSASRRSLLIAFGGGAAGDAAGFAAAVYMRGIRFVHVPTTLLAHDSAVGGKTAVNLPEGKNLAGAFHQPSAVLMDVSFFDTLPSEQVLSGFAELLKHAYLEGGTLWEQVAKLEAPLTPAALTPFLRRAMEVKVRIVEDDEREGIPGGRELLNFGHTLGHAVEAEAGYGALPHGACVLIGIIYALLVSDRPAEAADLYARAARWGFPVRAILPLSFDKLLARMKGDKKSSGGRVRFIFAAGPGRLRSGEAADERLREAWRALIGLAA